MTTDNAAGGGSSFSYYGKTPAGVEMALTLDIPPEWDEEAIGEFVAKIDAVLAKKKCMRSDRLDKPAGGWGGGNKQQAKPEVAPPADLVVPVHCELNMVYVPGRDATADRKEVAAHWDCRKGRGCATPRENSGNTYPFTDWHLTKKPAEKPAQPAQDGAQASKAPLAERLGGEAETIGYGDFLTRALRDYGHGKASTLKFAGKSEEEVYALGSAGWLDLLDKMRASKGVTA